MYKEKKCRICGKLFVPNSARQADCNSIIIKTCAVCGNKFESKCSKLNSHNTCSPECTKKYAKQKSEEAFLKTVKKCEWCGAEFHPKNNTQKYCNGIHYANCKVCGKQFIVDLSVNKSDIRTTCSKECAAKLQGAHFGDPKVREKIRETMIEKYGVEYPSQNAEIQAKMRATTKERYGAEHYRQTEEYADKVRETSLEKYGTTWPTQSQQVKDNVIAANIEKFGTASPMQNPQFLKEYQDKMEEKYGCKSPLAVPEIREKCREALLEKYGEEYYSRTDEFKEQYKQTSLEKYGTENPMQSDAVKQKSAETCLERYGATNYLASEEGKKHAREMMIEKYGVTNAMLLPANRKKFMTDPSKYDEWMKFLSDPNSYLDQFDEKQTYKQLASKFGVCDSVISERIIRFHLEDRIRYSLSTMEDELVELLHEIDPQINIKRHDRQTIKPNELDITLPDLRISIECNPTCTHNSSICDPWGNDPKPIAYHKQKTDKCEEVGVFLFHIFGHEWSHKKDIIKSMLRNLLGKNLCTIYARTCEIRQVTNNDARRFLVANHRQGHAGSSVRLGLYHEGKLVSLMTFGKMRSTIGTGKEDLTNCWELVRFCSLLDTSVVGGASKLFKYFVKHYAPQRIRSFSDRAHTRGNLYKQLGFNEINRSPFGYVWVDYLTDVAFHRSCAQKHHIKAFLHDDSIDLTQSENVIMESHGYVRVYDSGTITWEWRA